MGFLLKKQKKTGLGFKKKSVKKIWSEHRVNSLKPILRHLSTWKLHRKKISDEKIKVDTDLVALRTKENLGDFGEGPGLPQHG